MKWFMELNQSTDPQGTTVHHCLSAVMKELSNTRFAMTESFTILEIDGELELAAGKADAFPRAKYAKWIK